MSALPEITRMSQADQFAVRPIATIRSMEEHGRTLPPSKDDDDDDDDEECRTPTSEESKLPSIARSCPPAPRKPRRVLQCKRRLWSEPELIVVGAKEMEQLFELKGQWRIAPSHAKKKRRCSQADDN